MCERHTRWCALTDNAASSLIWSALFACQACGAGKKSVTAALLLGRMRTDKAVMIAGHAFQFQFAAVPATR
jgi:hypothetical protein